MGIRRLAEFDLTPAPSPLAERGIAGHLIWILGKWRVLATRCPSPFVERGRGEVGLLLILLITLSACNTAPPPTITPAPTQTAIPATFTPFPTIDTPVAARRTALPTLTPIGGVASATFAPPTIDPNAPPTATSALIAQASATLPPGISPTPSATLPSVQPGAAPPFTIDLPEGWNYTYTLIPINDLAGPVTVNVASYSGVIGGGRGFILVLWNFPTIVPISPRAIPTNVKDIQDQSSFSDGYRMLRGSILDTACAVNIYGRNYFKIGGREGLGQLYQTSGCLDNRPDLIGWYAGIWEGGKQYMFYSYVEPPQAYNNGQAALQAILNTVKFQDSPVSPIAPTQPAAPTPTGQPTQPGIAPTATIWRSIVKTRVRASF
jgi:hypothetical protein